MNWPTVTQRMSPLWVAQWKIEIAYFRGAVPPTVVSRYQDVWEGENETLVMGDFNIDLQRKESGCKLRMQLDTRSKLLAKGWTQMMAEKTFKSKSRTAGKKDAGSSIDWILSNRPQNIVKTKADWTGTRADHAIIWAVKEMRTKFRKTQMTRKRVWKKFQIDALEAEARSVNWSIAWEINSRDKLEEAVRGLECKIKQVMEKVAPMKTLEKKRKRSKHRN